ncbi:TOMM precursor leader peptide-binding protein [Microcoleus sp. OTE_8_concoct_300]|uniref:TOMM precursor leader peptide-binding protein n=1 Tax=Microcoleus sp. OTE_8_concoct_300 TaxID=2964710 RepID=UPI00403F1F37
MYRDYQPKFKNCFRLETERTEGVFLLSERNAALLSDPIYAQLAPLLDGNHSIDEIVNQLHDRLPASYIYYGLNQLKNQGYLSNGDEFLSPSLQIFCHQLNISLADARDRLQTTKVAVRAIGSMDAAELIQTLESHQIQVSEDADLEVVLCDDYLQLDLAALNQLALQQSRPWLLVKPIGTIIWLGPLFSPKKTGCWECLAQRLRYNRPIEGYLKRRTNDTAPLTPPLAKIPGVLQTALGMTAIEVLKWIVQNRENKRLQGVLITHDTLTLETQSHILTKRPQCPICGLSKTQNSAKPLPLILGSRKKTFTAEGGHRCSSPEATLSKYQHHISPITGVIRELQKLPDRLDGFHNYVAKHHFISMFDDLRALAQNIGGRSGGKGRTDIQARVSGFGEAIERYSGVFQGDEIRIKSSYQQLGDRAIHPNACMNFSQSQYSDRHKWNASCQSLFQRVPEPFDETKAIDWTAVWSLTQQEFKYLPTAYCYFGYPKPEKPDCWADTNGCAAGNTLEEAILQGFMELVERDSVALWWYNRIQRPEVDLESFDEPYFRYLQESYQSIHRDLWVLDLTSDLNIPTFVAVSRCGDRDSEDILLGFGSHFDAKIAVSRALTEINQILGVVLPTNAEGKTQYASSAEPLALNWWQTATLQNQPYLVPDKSSSAKVYADYAQNSSDDLLEDIKRCQQIVAQKGMEMLVLDQTRPDIGLKVVKVIVPGMRHFWKRSAAGRLYDVPVQMGWLNEPLSEDNLNPIPMWL